MLNAVIRFSLQNRLLVIAVAVFLLFYGGWQASRLPIDGFPDLDRPRVVGITEAPGLAPEEVEKLVTIPLEQSLNGSSGVRRIRSSSAIGISLIWVEFDWEMSQLVARQIVAEKLSASRSSLPASRNADVPPSMPRAAAGPSGLTRARTISDGGSADWRS